MKKQHYDDTVSAEENIALALYAIADALTSLAPMGVLELLSKEMQESLSLVDIADAITQNLELRGIGPVL